MRLKLNSLLHKRLTVDTRLSIRKTENSAVQSLLPTLTAMAAMRLLRFSATVPKLLRFICLLCIQRTIRGRLRLTIFLKRPILTALILPMLQATENLKSSSIQRPTLRMSASFSAIPTQTERQAMSVRVKAVQVLLQVILTVTEQMKLCRLFSTQPKMKHLRQCLITTMTTRVFMPKRWQIWTRMLQNTKTLPLQN